MNLMFQRSAEMSSAVWDNMKLDTQFLVLFFLIVSTGACTAASEQRHGERAHHRREVTGNFLRGSSVDDGFRHGSPKRLLGKLRELNLLELASVPGITNPSLLEVSLSPSACQFSLLEDLHHDINLNCQDYKLNTKKYNQCRTPKMIDKAQAISSKCCRTCTQCSGCEGLDVPDAEEYEKDSPGKWYSDRPELDREASDASASEGQGSSGPDGR